MKSYKELPPVGIALQEIRIAEKETLIVMAKKLFVSKTFLSSIVNGHRSPPGWLYDKVTSVYDLDESESALFKEAIALSCPTFKVSIGHLSKEDRARIIDAIRIMGGEIR